MTVNLTKNKVMVLCKSGKISKEKFYLNNVEIKNSTSYKYLSIIFSASGAYRYCQGKKIYINIASRLDT